VSRKRKEVEALGGGKGDSEGLEARLRLISVLFFAVGVAVLLVAVNTPLRFDENFGAGDRATLNVLT